MKNYKLLIDAGNSFCKIEVYDEHFDERLEFQAIEYKKLEQQLLQLSSYYQITSCSLCCVKNNTTKFLIEKIILQIWNITVDVVQVSSQQFLSTKYVINQLGVDRWVAMMGILLEGEKSFIVIDSGTATTIDVVIDSEHQGGLITAGMQVSLKALTQSTNIAIEDFSFEQHDVNNEILATSTSDCISKGTLLNSFFYMRCCIENIRSQYDQNLPVYISGGAINHIFLKICNNIHQRDNLVLNGLYRMRKKALQVQSR